MARHVGRTLGAPRLLGTFVVLGLLGGALTGCAGAATDPPGAPTSAAASSGADGAASPTPTASAAAPATVAPVEGVDDVDEEPPPAPVALTGDGVGDVLDGTPDALTAVEALLGPADRFEESPFAECGAPWISAASWGPVSVTFNDGTLFGWQLSGQDPVPATIALPHDIHVGDGFGQASSLPGASAPEFFDNYQVFMVSLDGVQWWADAAAADSPVTVIGHSIVGCG